MASINPGTFIVLVCDYVVLKSCTVAITRAQAYKKDDCGSQTYASVRQTRFQTLKRQ